jgi:hypothetical protein
MNTITINVQRLTPELNVHVRIDVGAKAANRHRQSLETIDDRAGRLMVTCPEPVCQGNGWYWDDERSDFFACVQCNGLGRIPILHEQDH